MFKKFKTLYILPILLALVLFVYAFSQGTFTKVLRFDGPDGASTLVSLTGVVIDAQGKPVEGADLFVGILEPEEQGGEFGSKNKLSFGDGGGTDCSELRPDSEYLWVETFPGNTNKQGRYDLMLGSTKPLQLKLNGRYYLELRVRKGAEKWRLFDLNPAVEDAGELNTCAGEFQSVSGPGKDEITTLHIGDGEVSTNDVADLSIVGDKIAFNAITGDKIADEAVSEAKLDDEAVYSRAIKKETIIDDRVSPFADIVYTKIEEDAPWYRGNCFVEVSADDDLLVWKNEGKYVGGTTVYRALKFTDDLYERKISSFEERKKVDGSTEIYKDGSLYYTSSETKYRMTPLTVATENKYRMTPKGAAFTCWADSGIAPKCFNNYASLTACQTADEGRCTAVEFDESCTDPDKPWGEYRTDQDKCTPVTYKVCKTDPGNVPLCFGEYNSQTECQNADNGRCVANGYTDDCKYSPGSPWTEYNTDKDRCTPVTYNNEPYKYLRVRCE